MLRLKFRILFLITMVFFALSDPAMAQTPNILGTWTGTAFQNTGSSNYKVILTISSDGPGLQNARTNYPDLNCGGILTRIGASKGYVFYTERITRGGQDSGGDCIDGTITVAKAGEKLAWGWMGSYDGEVYVAWSNLVRK